MSGIESDSGLRHELLNEEQTERTKKAEATSRTKQQLAQLRAAPKWELVVRKANELMDRGMEGYVEWTTGIMEIFNAFKLLNDALGETLKGNHPIEKLLEVVAGKAKDLAVAGLDKAGIYTPKPETKITYMIDFDEEGKLVTQLRKNGVEKFTDEKQEEAWTNQKKELFDVGFVMWLSNKGLTVEKDQIVDKATKKVLTPEEFKAIDVDDDNGLNAFFQGRYQMPIERTPTPLSTTPTP